MDEEITPANSSVSRRNDSFDLARHRAHSQSPDLNDDSIYPDISHFLKQCDNSVESLNLVQVPAKYRDETGRTSLDDVNICKGKYSTSGSTFVNVIPLRGHPINGVRKPARRSEPPSWRLRNGTENTGFSPPTSSSRRAAKKMESVLCGSLSKVIINASPASSSACQSESSSVNNEDVVSPTSSSFNVSRYKADDDFLRQGLSGDNKNLKYIDTHCHLDLLFSRCKHESQNLDDFMLQYSNLWSPHFAGCVADFCFPEFLIGDNFAMWDNVSKSDKVWLAIGLHPHAADKFDEDLKSAIEGKLSSNFQKIVAVGELGLDYSANNSVDHEIQKQCLEDQLQLALKYRKPILLHCRDAADDCWPIFKKIVPSDHPIHWHCYSDSEETFRKWSEYFTNIYFGVTLGVYTPRPRQENFWKSVPLDRLLIETDSPYFLPQRFRSKELGSLQHCHPGLGALVAWKLADYKTELKVEDIMAQTLKNTKKIYNI